MENNSSIITINGIQVEKAFFRESFNEFLNEILIREEVEEVEFFKTSYDFDLIDYVLENFDSFREITGDKDLSLIEIPLNKADEIFKRFSFGSKLESYDDSDGRLYKLIRRLLIAFYMYFEKNGQPKMSVEMYNFIQRTISDICDRFELIPPQEISSLVETLKKRTDVINSKESRQVLNLDGLLNLLNQQGINPKDLQIHIQAIVNNGNGNIQNMGSSSIDANINIS